MHTAAAAALLCQDRPDVQPIGVGRLRPRTRTSTNNQTAIRRLGLPFDCLHSRIHN